MIMNVIDSITAIIAPHQCLACGDEGSVLCGRCITSAGNSPISRCAGCKVLTTDFSVCKSCKRWLPLTQIQVATEYDGIYEQLVKSYKFDCARQAVEPIAKIMVDTIDFSQTGKIGVIYCPLPTAPSRIRQRGFDHTRLLMQTIAGKSPDLLATQLLSRKTNIRQLGSTRAQRMKQLNGEFYVSEKNKSLLHNAHIVLVDDVVTTGASLAAAAAALKKAGAARVSAIVFAQKT